MDRKKVYFNISGCPYETFVETLQRYPRTLLGNPQKRCKFYDRFNGCYFIDRSRIAFEAILFYYQSNGRLVRPPFLSMEIFESECQFYGLSEDVIRGMKEKEIGEGVEDSDNKNRKLSEEYNHKLKKIWIFMEHPESCVPAQLFMIFSVTCIFVVLSLDCLETVPNLFTSPQLQDVKMMKKCLTAFFAVEFLVRISSCPSILQFVATPQNVVDAIAIFPSFILFFTTPEKVAMVVFTNLFRSFRVFRLMKLSKQFESLSVVLNIFASSCSNLFVLLVCMVISITLFGSMVYYTELGASSTPIVSIPEGMWFAMQTVVSLGYGDIIPVSILGKVTASITAVIGALTMTLPLLSLGGKYYSIYTKTFNVVISEDLTIKSHKVR